MQKSKNKISYSCFYRFMVDFNSLPHNHIRTNSSKINALIFLHSVFPLLISMLSLSIKPFELLFCGFLKNTTPNTAPKICQTLFIIVDSLLIVRLVHH